MVLLPYSTFSLSQGFQKLLEYLNLSKFLTLSYDRKCLCHHVLLRILVQVNTFGFWYWYFLNMGEDFLYFTSFCLGFILLIKSHVLWAWLDAAMKYCLIKQFKLYPIIFQTSMFTQNLFIIIHIYSIEYTIQIFNNIRFSFTMIRHTNTFSMKIQFIIIHHRHRS